MVKQTTIFLRRLSSKLTMLLLVALAVINTRAGAQCKDWVRVGGVSGGVSYFYQCIAVDGAGTIFTASRDSSTEKITVRKFSGGSWTIVGSAGLSVGAVDAMDLKIDASNTPYVAFFDHALGAITVKKFDGSSWVNVGAAGFSSADFDNTTISLAFDAAGAPYVAFKSTYIVVMKYNGISWESLGSAVVYTSGTDPSMAFDNITGDLYVAYRTYGSPYYATVTKYNGSSWSQVGATNISEGSISNVEIDISSTGIPYIAYDLHAGATDGSVIVKTFNGTSWSALGGTAITGYLSGCDFKLGPGDVPYVCTYMHASTSSGVAKFNGSSWGQLGGNESLYGGMAWGPEMAIAPDGKPFMSYLRVDGVVQSLETVGPTITGTASICSGATTTLTHSVESGIWSSLASSVATVGSSTGIVTSVAAGLATISYRIGQCYATKTVTVGPFAGSINGPLVVASGNSITLSNTVGGGSWTISNSNATINSSGVVTGVAAGTTIVTYTTTGSCGSAYDTKLITVTTPTACYSWNLAGSSALSSGWASICNIKMDASGVPYIGYLHYGSGYSLISEVKKYNGAEWVSLHPEDVFTETVLGGMTVTPSGTLYASGGDPSNYLHTYKFDAGVWSEIPSPNEWHEGIRIGSDAAGTVYELHYIWSPTLSRAELTLAKFNGASWDDLGSPGNEASQAQLTFSGTTPYVVFADADNSNKITVRKYNGASWVTVGSAITALDGAYSYSLAVDNGGVPYLCFGPAPGSAMPTQVLKYTGSTWVDAGLDASQIAYPRITMGDDDIPYLFGAHLDIPSRFVMLKYNGSTWDLHGQAAYEVQSPMAAIGASGDIFVADNTNLYGSSYQGTVLKYVQGVTMPPIVADATAFCFGEFTGMTNTHPTGIWSTNNSIATINPYNNDGVVFGAGNGTSTVSYTSGTCSATIVVTVGTPSPGNISGTLSVCTGATTTLTYPAAGAEWYHTHGEIAMVDATTGVVTGVSAGTAPIFAEYFDGCGFFVDSVIVTVTDPGTSVDSITGIATLSTGGTTTLSDATTGGAWSSGNTSVATVGSATGIVTGVSAGTAEISYAIIGGCAGSVATKVVTVNLPPVLGSLSISGSGTTTLSNAIAGGSWSTGCSNIATVTSDGVVTAVSNGLATITYTVGSDYTTAVVTVNMASTAISGTLTACAGTGTTLAHPVSGGVWSSGNTSIAAASTGGLVTGVAVGSANISYAYGSGCSSIATVTINPMTTVGAIAGTATICAGSTTTLTNATTGGTWSSSHLGVATVGASTGIVTGLGTGNATITYAVSGACGTVTATKVVTVGATASITGTLSLCSGMTSSLSGGTTGGVWSSGNTAVATIGAANGVLTAMSIGIANITYAMSGGCTATAVVTVSMPAIIGGTSNACVGQTATLTDATAGGTWSSSNTSLAAVDASTGVVTGVAAGTATISYVVSSGCYRTIAFTVKALPPAIAGPVTVCEGSTVYVTPPSTNGQSWSSSNTSVAVIGSSTGMLTGVTAGTTTLTYNTITGCFVTTTATVTAGPGVIGGTLALCSGSVSSLSNATAGGTWSSSNNSVASIGSATGVVTAGTTGTATVTYNTGGCRATAIVTVSPIAAITGTPSMCVGSSATLANTSAGGTWSSSNSGIASVGTSGIVTGVTVGNATITYTIASGCTRTVTATVVATPGAITGSLSICPGTAATLSGGTAGGTWSGSNASIATINSSTGVLTGIGAGTINVSYTFTGCRVTAIATVNPLPAVITGTVNACVDQTSTLANATAGGAWSSANTGIATVDPSTGVVTGVTAATTTITYTLGTGCYRATPFTVKALPPAIATTAAACVGTSTYMAPPSTNGKSWSSSNTAVATIGSSTGMMAGVSTGTTILTYTTTTGCYVTTEATVYALPSAGVITGPSSVIVGNTVTLDDAAGGGVWSSSNPARASIGAVTGIVTGVAGGTATISYSVSNPGCTVRATKVISVLTSRLGNEGQFTVGSMQLYPNPTTGAFTVEVEEAGTFSIFSLDGKEVSRHIVTTGINQLTLSSDLASGIYMCRFAGESGNTMMVRLVYER